MAENHGLPQELKNGRKLRIDTYGTLFDREGYSIDEVDKYYGGLRAVPIVKIYSYIDEEEAEGERVGVEFVDGVLAIYGCNADIDDCGSDEVFVEELTDPYYNS